MRKTLIAILAMAAFGCPEESTTQTPPPSPPATQPATQTATAPLPPPNPPGTQPAAAGGDLGAGKRVYLTACANCHGPDGTGAMMRQVLPKIGDLTSPEMHGRMSDQDIISLVRTGRDKMPAFGEALDQEQLTSLVAYVRSLKKQ